MRRADLWRHSPFRLALGVTFFILATLILASGVGYGLMQRQLSQRQDARVTEIFSAIAQTSQESDETDLIEAITTRIQASPDQATVFLLRAADGRMLAGNINPSAVPAGWSTVPASALGVASDYPYRIFSATTGAYSLTIGLSNADQDDLQEIVFAAFGWAALLALLAITAVAAVLAIRVQNRLALAEIAVARIAQGDLSARLPVSRRGDDLDYISTAINLSLVRLESSVDAMRQVSADIAHDLRTPLNRLRIRIESAGAKVAQGLPAEDDLAAALAESDTINATFSALLRIAQIESGARRQNFAPVDLTAIMANVAEVYANVAEDAGQSLQVALSPGAWVNGDKELLTQALANLIENAIRHCAAENVITCTVTCTGDQAFAVIRDTGPGIPAEEREKVLRRLYRLEKSRTTEGTGLGLALVKAVADLHGADLDLGDAAPGLQVSLRFQCRDQALSGVSK